MAAADVLGPAVLPYPEQEPSPPVDIPTLLNDPQRVHFDPKIHLRFDLPEKVYTLEDLKYPFKQQAGNVAATDPFPIFTREAIVEMRRELFAARTFQNCMSKRRAGSVQIRGAAPQYAPFVYEAWTHPATLAAVERVVGCRVVTKLDQDIAHTNVQLTESGLAGLAHIPAEPIEPLPSSADVQEEEDIAEDKDTDVIGWHHDMYPFSLTVALSLPTGKGGETALMCHDGTIMKAQKPDVVSSKYLGYSYT